MPCFSSFIVVRANQIPLKLKLYHLILLTTDPQALYLGGKTVSVVKLYYIIYIVITVKKKIVKEILTILLTTASL